MLVQEHVRVEGAVGRAVPPLLPLQEAALSLRDHAQVGRLLREQLTAFTFGCCI